MKKMYTYKLTLTNAPTHPHTHPHLHTHKYMYPLYIYIYHIHIHTYLYIYIYGDFQLFSTRASLITKTHTLTSNSKHPRISNCAHTHAPARTHYTPTHPRTPTCAHAHTSMHAYAHPHTRNTEWPRPVGSLKLQVIFRKRATTYRALLRKMTYKDVLLG